MNNMAISTYLAIIALNVNGLNSPIKRHVNVFQKICVLPTKDSLQMKVHSKTESNGMKKDVP